MIRKLRRNHQPIGLTAVMPWGTRLRADTHRELKTLMRQEERRHENQVEIQDLLKKMGRK